ncbi:hypothetical protein SAMN05428950_102457 [Sphingomonas sp. OV641]|uniref:hypothetical protein n=1 Tax=Sphingomonas sp. OV641 TaxID=1881068 RepID=UPI0008B9F08C|nr:hypothetical protein [Sphingomonas sp. OV641]SEJ66422.1 hypothetical protein SAMN05428950_102457 [Sphingomonas sp. OV641]
MTDTAVTHTSQPGKAIGSFVGQLLMAATLTAIAGALGNSFYEFFFDPEAFAAGPVFARAAFAIAFPFPFILAALLVVGTPTALLLRRLHLDNLIVFGLVGAFAGVAIGLALASGLPGLQTVFSIYGCVSAVTYWALQQRKA